MPEPLAPTLDLERRTYSAGGAAHGRGLSPRRFRAPLAKQAAKGFTLVELLTTVAVLAILLTVAAPGLQTFVQRNRLVAVNNDLLTALTLARSEAIKRATPVTVCSSPDGTNCGGTWTDGWIVFVNPDNDSPAVRDLGNPVDPADDEILLRVFPTLPAGYTLNLAATSPNHLTYDRAGAANQVGTFVACHDSDESRARAITLTRLRPRIAKDTDGDGIPNTDAGNIASCENP